MVLSLPFISMTCGFTRYISFLSVLIITSSTLSKVVISRPILSSMRLISRLPPRIIYCRLLCSTFYSFSNFDRYASAIMLHQPRWQDCDAHSYHPASVNYCHVRAHLHIRAAPFYMPAKKRPTLADKRLSILNGRNAALSELLAIVKKVLSTSYRQCNASVSAERTSKPAAYAKVLYAPSAP